MDKISDVTRQDIMQRFEGRKVKEDPDILPYREAFRALNINPNKYFPCVWRRERWNSRPWWSGLCNRTAGAYPPLDLDAKRKRKNHFCFHRHILSHWWFYRFQSRACTCCAGWTPDANSADLGLQNNCWTCRFWKSVYGIITEMNYLWKIPDDWLLLYSVAAIKQE